MVSSPSRCTAPGNRRSTARWISRWRANTTSGSPEARKSSIQASAPASFPRAASRWQRRQLGQALGRAASRRSARRAGRDRAAATQPSDHVVLGQSILGLVGQRDRDDDLALGGQLRRARRPCSRRTKQRRRKCQCSRSSLCWLSNSRANRAPEPKSSSRPMHPQLRDQLVGMVQHRRAGQREPQAVGGDRLGEPPHRLRALGMRVLAVVRLVDHQRPRRAGAQAPRDGRRRSRS